MKTTLPFLERFSMTCLGLAVNLIKSFHIFFPMIVGKRNVRGLILIFPRGFLNPEIMIITVIVAMDIMNWVFMNNYNHGL